MHNTLNVTVPLQMLDSDSRKRTVYFETFDKDGLRDELEGGDFLEDSVKGHLVDGDSVLSLVLDLSLGPLLLLGRLSSTR